MQPRLNIPKNPAITDQIFPNNLMHEFSSALSESTILQAVSAVAYSSYRDKIYLNDLSEEHCDKHVIPLIPSLGVKTLGLKKLSSLTVEKIFHRLSKSSGFPQAIGMDELDVESLRIIFSYFVSAMSRNYHIHFYFGPSIHSEWVLKFNSLLDHNFLLREVQKLLKSLIENRSDERIRYLDIHRHLREDLRQSEEKNSELKQKQEAMKEELKDLDNKYSRKRQKLEETSYALQQKKESLLLIQHHLKVEHEKNAELVKEAETAKSTFSTMQNEINNMRGLLLSAQQILDRSVKFNKIATDMLDELKQTQLFKNEPSKELNAAFMQNKKRKKPPEEKQRFDMSNEDAANNLLSLMSDSMPSQDDSANEEKTVVTSINILPQFQAFLLDNITSQVSGHKPHTLLKSYISKEIKVCEEIFKEGKSFTKLDDREIKSLFYYIAFLVCDIHQKNSQKKPSLTSTIFEYLNQVQQNRPISRVSLLYTMNRMADTILNVADANMWLRVGNIKTEEIITALKKEIQQSSASNPPTDSKNMRVSVATSRSVLFSSSSSTVGSSTPKPDTTVSTTLTM